MTAAPSPRCDRIAELSADQFRARLAEALQIYVDAMGYPPVTAQQRAPMWSAHTLRPGWRCIGAFNTADELIGIGYGYRGVPGQWWHEQVLRGLLTNRSRDEAEQWMQDYFELTELHVRPDSQGGGLGETILRRLLDYTPRNPVIDGLQYREGLQAVRIEGGVAGNVVPDSCVVAVNHRFAPDKSLARDVNKVGVVGAGLMAGQLALLFVRRLKVPVVITDVDQERIDKGVAYIHGEIDKLQGKGRLTADAANRLKALVTGSLDKGAFADADFVIEAVFEEMSVKQKVFDELEQHVSPEAILATNTSSLSITEMASKLQHPERVVGFHFFNPVAVLPLLEVVRGEKTDDASLATAFKVGKQLKKSCVLVKDAPAFVVNRLLTRFMGEIIAAVDEGTPFDVADKALAPLGLPMSPLVLLQLVGPAVAQHVNETMHAAYPDRFGISENLDRFVKAGKTAVWQFDEAGNQTVDPEVAELWQQGDNPSTTEQVRERALKALAEEARLMLDEGVEDVGVGFEDAFDLFGVDLFAAGVDDGGAAAEHADGAVWFVAGVVAGHDVADAVDLAEDLGGFGGVVVVAEGHVPRAGEQADFGGVGGQHGAVGADDGGGAVGVDLGPAGVDGVGGEHADAAEAGFGAADGVGEHDVRQGFEVLLLHRGGEQRGAAGDGHQGGGVVLAGVVGLDEGPGHGVAGDGEDVDGVVLDGAPDPVRVEFGQQDDGAAGEEVAEGGPLRGAVDERRGG